MRFRSSVLGTLLGVASALIAGSAVAGDGATNGADNWSGFYSGINGGYGKIDGSSATGFDDARSEAASKNTPTASEPASSAQSGHSPITVYGVIDGGMAFRAK